MGGLLAMTAAALLSLAAAKLTDAGMLPMKSAGIAAYIILGVSAAAGALFAALNGKRRILLLCLISATVCFLTAAVINGFLQRGEFHRIWQTALTVYGASAAVGLLLAGRKKKY